MEPDRNKTIIQKLRSIVIHLFRKEIKESDPMKYLIVGLGNMDIEYDETRHNIGFKVIDSLVEKNEAAIKHERLGDLSKIKYRGRTLYLLKPSTYMNRSGKAVSYWVNKLNIQKSNLFIIVDDLNLELGRLRIRSKGSDGGHNGLNDIQQYIGTAYARLRFGIGSDFHKGYQVDHVLGKWTDDEKSKLPALIDKAIEAVYNFSFRGIQQTMNRFNN